MKVVEVSNILFVWTGVTSYMGDCWRALARTPGVRLKILIQEKQAPDTAFKPDEILQDLDYRMVYEGQPLACEPLTREILSFRPDVIFVVGWRAALSRLVTLEPAMAHVPKVLVFDLPFAWTLRKILAPIVLHQYLKHFRFCYVPGGRASAYARWLGFRADQIQKGLFAVAKSLPLVGEGTCDGFLFAGRYVQEKRLDILVEAYARYRMKVFAANKQLGHDEEPWGLTCCGQGPEGSHFINQPGIKDIGFCQPAQMAFLRQSHGALVVTSVFDPWPLVIAEACASGLPVICTEACGNSQELVQGNGIICRTNDVEAITRAMLMFHSLSNLARKTMGEKGQALVAPYLCDAWRDRVIKLVAQILLP